VERDRQLDDAEAAAEVAARGCDRRDDRLPDLVGELHELPLGEAAEVGRAFEARQDRGRHVGRALQEGRGGARMVACATVSRPALRRMVLPF
jgi:hypothetical protein